MTMSQSCRVITSRKTANNILPTAAETIIVNIFGTSDSTTTFTTINSRSIIPQTKLLSRRNLVGIIGHESSTKDYDNQCNKKFIATNRLEKGRLNVALGRSGHVARDWGKVERLILRQSLRDSFVIACK